MHSFLVVVIDLSSMRARASASASSSHWLSAACFQLRPPKRAKLKGRKLELQIIGENYAVDAQTDAHVRISSTKAIVLPNVEVGGGLARKVCSTRPRTT